MWLRVVAGVALAVLLWRLFRLAMGLRFAKVEREAARRAEESRGRRVVAEIPHDDGLLLFVEDAVSFRWGADAARKADVVAARLLLNGATFRSASRPGAALPPASPPEEPGGRERWDVALHLADGTSLTIHCGALREGVSRETASAVFESVRAIFSA